MDATLEGVVPVGRRGAAQRAGAFALGLVIVIATLIAKPWTSLGAPTPSSIGEAGGPTRSAPATTAGSTLSPGAASAQAPDVSRAGPRAGEAAASAPPGAYVENLEPIEPDRWAHLSGTLRTVNADGVVLVARYPHGLYYGFLPARPSASPQLRPPLADGTSNTVRITGYLGNPVAIGLTRPADAAAPSTAAWQVLGPGRLVRVTLRHPVGDLDRYLYLGPGLGLPPGERRNRREISRWPPTWQAGVYRFDLATDGGTRYLFVVLEP